MAETIIVELGTKHFQEANAAVRAALAEADTVCIVEAYAQRYLGCTLPTGKRLEIHGTPGNDLACYMDGGEVEVFGSAQDQTANTMNAGTVVVHGRVGDAAGYAMRGGELIVRDGCGWRGGINMKQYGGKCPVIVTAGMRQLPRRVHGRRHHRAYGPRRRSFGLRHARRGHLSAP